jgi:hypothetical protein
MAWRFQVDWMNECHHCGSPYHFGRSCLAELGCSYEECNKPYGHCITGKRFSRFRDARLFNLLNFLYNSMLRAPRAMHQVS